MKEDEEKKRPGIAEVVVAGMLEETFALGRTARSEAVRSIDIFGSKPCKCRRRR